MLTTASLAPLGGSARHAFACLCAGSLSVAAVAAATATPRLVSPGAPKAGSVNEARCPTFSWAGVAGAAGYEIAIFQLQETSGGEPVLVSRASVPGDARSFTPAIGQCLERGRRYAWSVAANRIELGARDPASDRISAELDDSVGAPGHPASGLDWAPALVFEVEAAPSPEEVEHALAVLERYAGELDLPRPARSTEPRDAPRAGGERRSAGARDAERERARLGGAREARDRHASEDARDEARAAERRSSGSAPLDDSPPTGILRAESSASPPSPGSASLALSSHIELADTSALFKNGDLFLWDDDGGNTALGRDALASLSGNATENTAIGRGALRNNHGVALLFAGARNTAVGDRALYTNSTGFLNTATGAAALYGNTTGDRNTALGANALHANTEGYGNTAAGVVALEHNDTGSLNTATGTHALRANTSGFRNTATGAYALEANTEGIRNTAHGAAALYSNTTGDRNTAIGVNALRTNSTGIGNTAAGVAALYHNTGGKVNVAVGFEALRSNTEGGGNTAVGTGALEANTTGSYNIAIGYGALRYLGEGSNNIAIGKDAGYWAFGAFDQTSNNIFIGNRGNLVDDEGGDIFIGNASDHRRIFLEATEVFDVFGTDSVSMSGIATSTVSGAAVLVTPGGRLGVASSSRALKQDIEELGSFSERLLELRPVAFRYREHAQADPDAPLEFGLIAEEVAEVFPELVVWDEEGKPRTVKYHLLGSLLLGELQRQHHLLEELQAELERLRTRRANPAGVSTAGR